MPKQFSKFGLSFHYPDNWVLDEEEVLSGQPSATVYHPEVGAFWTMAIHPSNATPEDLVEAAVEILRDEYPREEVEVNPIEKTFEGRTFVGREIDFQHLDLVCHAIILAVATEQASLTVFYQAEDRDFAQSASTFEAITTSLARSLDGLSVEWDNANDDSDDADDELA